MLETYRRLRDYVANIQIMSRDMMKRQLSQHFCHATKNVSRDMSFVLRRSDNVVTFIHLEVAIDALSV